MATLLLWDNLGSYWTVVQNWWHPQERLSWGWSPCLQPPAGSEHPSWEQNPNFPSATHIQKATLQPQLGVLLCFPLWASGGNSALHYGCSEAKYRLQAERFFWNHKQKGRNARSGHKTLWPVKLNCLLQILTFGWTVSEFVILWGEEY